MSYKKNSMSLLLSFVMVLSMVFLLTSCGQTTVDVSDYITVTYDSYNTMGSAKVNIDSTGLNALVDKETVNEYMSKFPVGQQSIAWGYSFNFAELLDIKLKEDYSELSNGDKIVVKINLFSELVSAGETIETLQKALKIRIPQTEIEFTVNGLQEAKILDLITPVEEFIVYSGGNGGGIASFEIPTDFQKQLDDFILVRGDYTNVLRVIKNNTEICAVRYDFGDDKFTLSNLTGNDRIEFYCEYYYNRLDKDEADYDTILNKKEIVVPDLGDYVTSKDMLTNDLKVQIINSLDARYPEIKSCTFFWGTLKPTATSDNINRDSAKLFGYVQYTGVFGTTTLRCEFEIIKKPDNTYSITWEPFAVGKQETPHNSDYVVEEITF